MKTTIRSSFLRQILRAIMRAFSSRFLVPRKALSLAEASPTRLWLPDSSSKTMSMDVSCFATSDPTTIAVSMAKSNRVDSNQRPSQRTQMPSLRNLKRKQIMMMMKRRRTRMMMKKKKRKKLRIWSVIPKASASTQQRLPSFHRPLQSTKLTRLLNLNLTESSSS